jgi:hypothetical protein
VATKHDLDLAKMLLTSRVLDEDGLRQAFELQGKWLHDGRIAALPEVLYALELLPQGALDALGGAGPESTQPFPGYRIDGIVGEGGMSTVYAATQALSGARVALKVMKPLMALRPDFAARFQEEAQLLMRLEHPGIVTAYEVGQASGYHYFAMELIGGSTVQEVVERRGHLTNPEALSITVQVAEALDYLHGQGLLHRDMKPGNVMVEPDGRARLIDLGLVGRMSTGGVDTAGGAEGAASASHTVGTVEYLSPEQARGRSDLDARTDVYSLGVSLYHMVVGEVPFQGANDMEVMAKQIMASIDQEKVKTRRISPELHFFIAKMTAKERESRFGSMKDVLREIRGYLPQGLVAVDLGGPARVIPVGPAHAGAGARGVPVARPLGAPGAVPTLRPMAPTVKPLAGPAAPPVLRPVVAPPVVRPVAAPPVVRPVAAPPVMRPVTPPPVVRPAAPPPVARPVAPPLMKPLPAPPVVRPVVPPTATPVAAPVVRPLAPVVRPVAPATPPVIRPVGSPPAATPVVRPVVPVVPPTLPVARPVAPAMPPGIGPVAKPVPTAPPRSPAPAASPLPVAPKPASLPPAPPKPATPAGDAPAKQNPFAGKAPVPKNKR